MGYRPQSSPSISDFELLEVIAQEEARQRFWAYRRYMNPKMKIGWWQKEIARELQGFYDDLVAGRKPMLVIQAPPQHGKSEQVIDFIAWLAGQNPDVRTIYTSFSERLGIRANLRLQRTFDSERYKRTFPGTRLNTSNVVTVSGQTLRNREILEFARHQGYFRNTTVRGSITGESLDLGVMDDPIKGREEANSQAVRDKTWDWFTDDFYSRFSENGGLLAILTRWHIDDPIGRLIQEEPRVRVLSYPAIAEHDEPHRKAGEALFPEHKSLEFLLQRRALMDEGSWQSLYQQNPIISGGNLFKEEHFVRYRELPALEWRGIYADTAQKTGERNDFSVFEVWGKSKDGRAYLIDLVRARMEAPELEQTALTLWKKHKALTNEATGTLRKMAIEDKVSGTGLIQSLKRQGVPVKAIGRNRDKYTRAMDVLPSVAAGLVAIPEQARWLPDFMSETLAFPDGAHDDQVDPMLDAIGDLLMRPESTTQTTTVMGLY